MIETAKSSRSRCCQCNRIIAKGELRHVHEEVSPWSFDEYIRVFTCLECVASHDENSKAEESKDETTDSAQIS